MRVPLHELHQKLGARFVEFSGYDMPVLYSSILEEHEAVRQRAGLFDVSHMSNLWVRGPGAEKLVSEAFASNPQRIKPGRGSYTVAMREDGTIIDDLIYYKFTEQEFHVVVNAGMNRTMTSWLEAHAGHGTTIEDVTSEYCIFAVQGPLARDVLGRVYDAEKAAVKKFGFLELRFGKRKGLIAGTGYTGEDGAELIVPNEEGLKLFPRLLEVGATVGLKPIGLGARDTLRLEKGYCLASHEFHGGRSPLEAGLEWVVHWDHAFVGKHALEAQKTSGDYERLVGVKVQDRGIPRQGHAILNGGRRVGAVTSGTMSPTLKQGIALGYVPPASAAPGTPLELQIREQAVPCAVTKLPFV